jgi:hypothetical protein
VSDNPHEWRFVEKDDYGGLYRYASTFGDPDYRMGTGVKSRIYFSTVNVDVVVKRLLRPYVFTFFLPLTIILGIILLILWVPLEQFAPRINASISGLVGLLVYHMSQKNAFPKVGYSMMADYYFILGYVFVVILMINIIATQVKLAAGHKDQARRRNKIFAVAALGTILASYAVMTALGMRA